MIYSLIKIHEGGDGEAESEIQKGVTHGQTHTHTGRGTYRGGAHLKKNIVKAKVGGKISLNIGHFDMLWNA